ncbi:MAG: response regulator transcription factor [Prolixibacteraceae bacterium]|jgi:DNA-binding NarL/FixJ family response regulator
MNSSSHKLIIADSQFLIVESLKVLIENDFRFSLLSTCRTQCELFKILRNESCDVLITDIALLDYNGVSDLQKIKQKFPELAILILTNSISKPEFTELSKIGIKNILYKTADREEVLMALDSILKGKKYYSEEILDMIIEISDSKNVPVENIHLTSSEIEIVRLIAGGMTTKEIAEKKNISFHTVNTHRKNIFRKLSVSNTSELIIHAIKSGWIDNIEYFI